MLGRSIIAVYIAWPVSFAIAYGIYRAVDYWFKLRAYRRQLGYWVLSVQQGQQLTRLGYRPKIHYASPSQSRAINARLSNCPSVEIASDRRHFGTPLFR